MSLLNYSCDGYFPGMNPTNNMTYEYVIDNIDNNISICNDREDNGIVVYAIKTRNSIMNLLNDCNIDECDEETDEDLDKLKELYNKFIYEFKENQQIYYDNKIIYEKEINNCKSNMKKLDLIIQFIREFEEDGEGEQMENLLNNLKYLSEKIENNKNIVEAKKEYVKSRKNIQKSLNLIKKLNLVNVSNACPLCLTNSVNVYLNPCGHTCCESCYEKVRDNHNNKCFICRDFIINKKSIYFS
jgi:uncharacterized UPF0160 family protein